MRAKLAAQRRAAMPHECVLQAGAVVLALAGCGRIAFDSSTDGDPRSEAGTCPALGHDEDGDSIDDACDVCPHLSDPLQSDRDGDRVGDGCDPNPDTPSERIAFFDPLTLVRPEVGLLGPMSFGGDAITGDARGTIGYVFIGVVPGNGVFRYGGHVGAGGSGDRKIALGALNSPAFIYCEVYNPVGAGMLNLAYTEDSAVYNTVASTPAQQPLENADVFLSLDRRTLQHGCESDWPANNQRIEGAIPPVVVPTNVMVEIHDVIIRLDYLIQIMTE